MNPHLGDLDECVKKNMPLVVKIVHDWVGKTKTQSAYIDDLIQEGAMGIVEAYDKYKPDKNIKFSSFAKIYILKNIRKYARDYTGSSKPSKHSSER